MLEQEETEPTKTSPQQLLETHQGIVLFDGVCNLCNASVQFIIDREPAGYFVFTSLQSQLGQELCGVFGIEAGKLDSIVLLEKQKAFQRSTAALRIARKLTFPWFLLSVFFVIPRFLRDPVYNFIGRNRYRWFGKEEVCRIPTPELKQRFL
ncbi:MAG: thiol-disulfide oxidoreductase DCC family protein [Myxococcales bacterium]|nr:thiol-disulfide oxidoreductase DCC family protein [Myxococcales bacterium]